MKKIYRIKVNGKTYKVELEAVEEVASKEANKAEVKKEEAKEAPKTAPSGEGNKVLSPIQGNVIELKVKVGDKVKRGQVVAIVEAMKLENEIVSEFDGEVAEILVSKGNTIASKAALMIVK